MEGGVAPKTNAHIAQHSNGHRPETPLHTRPGPAQPFPPLTPLPFPYDPKKIDEKEPVPEIPTRLKRLLQTCDSTLECHRIVQANAALDKKGREEAENRADYFELELAKHII